MKNYIVMLVALLISCTTVFVSAATTPTLENSIYTTFDEPQDERYVIVYRMNGGVHVTFVNGPLCCSCLQVALHYFNIGITIIDCGPVGQVSPPSDATEVSEAETLLNFQFEEWPTDENPEE